MREKATFATKPAPILYMLLPTSEADVWLRKNIGQSTDSETGQVVYEADEAYMRTTATETEVAADFEGFYESAAAWQPLRNLKTLCP